MKGLRFVVKLIICHSIKNEVQVAGRPREFDRNAALLKARDVFWSRGYEGVSMADLVEELGLASARIYAAFGSKEALFREAITLYNNGDGGFATRALASEPTVRGTLKRILIEAIETYTRPGYPHGCMVVTAATNCATNNDNVRKWLAVLRYERTTSLIERLGRAAAEGELSPDTDVQVLGDHFATVLHGLSVQARDGVSRDRLMATVPLTMRILD